MPIPYILLVNKYFRYYINNATNIRTQQATENGIKLKY